MISKLVHCLPLSKQIRVEIVVYKNIWLYIVYPGVALLNRLKVICVYVRFMKAIQVFSLQYFWLFY